MTGRRDGRARRGWICCLAAGCLAVLLLSPGAAWAKKCFNIAHLLEAELRAPPFSTAEFHSIHAINRLNRYALLSQPKCVRAVTRLAGRLLSDDNSEVRDLAARALSAIGPPAAAAVPALREAQKHSACACNDGRCQWRDDGPGTTIAIAIANIMGDDEPGIFNCRPPDAPPTPP
jgi:hypothetical protein